MTIISQKSDDIKAYILANLERGVTILKAKGAYSGKELDVLYVALKRRELSEILHLVKNIDSEAFVIVTEARYVLGEGFKRIDKVA